MDKSRPMIETDNPERTLPSCPDKHGRCTMKPVPYDAISHAPNCDCKERWDTAIRLLAHMYDESAGQTPKRSLPEKIKPRRKPYSIRIHAQFVDCTGKVWHEHDSVYRDPKTADAPAGKPSSDARR